MNTIIKGLLSAFILTISSTAHATTQVIDFDDYSNIEYFESFSGIWNNFQWNEMGVVNTSEPVYAGSGFGNGSVSGIYAAYSNYGQSEFAIEWQGPGTFDFVEGYFTAGWDVELDVSFQGLLNGNEVYASQYYTINRNSPTLISLNWANIDSLVITQTGTNLVMDNFTISAVPEPSTYALLLGGLSLVGFIANRRKKHS